MPAVYPDYPCECCGNSHTLYFSGLTVPDLRKPVYFLCTMLPVEIRVTRGDSWKPMGEKPEGALEVYRRW